MPFKRIHRLRAVALAVALVGWGVAVKPRLSGPLGYAVPTAFAAALVAITGAPLGLRPPAVWSGVRLGAAVSAVAVGALAATTASPAIRDAMAERTQPDRAPEWLLVRIPLGTVWSEEAAFRAALATVATAAFGRRGGRLLQAGAFGLWHIPDARSSGELVVGTVVITAAAGWLFALLRERSGSLAAPMLVHLAVNEAGAIAVLWARSRSRAGQQN